ncbi:MAG TPA: CDF family Co(II)/Ni(II) efflux transporter DmeF [Steroidobacteraceae bacterium]|nr:CDF family Co(II)/Ni(II) efflux transporter DmeF [Steroidobacteraceae bacterium]
MPDSTESEFRPHSHVFLAADHERSERRTWAVIILCGAMMAAEIVGGILFGSIALVADGLHMSTHAGALLLAALAYSYARKHASDSRFCFGTGKLGDLAGFTSAIVLAMIAALIGYESVLRVFQPVAIHFTEAIPIACLGLAVNISSAWLLSSSGSHHHAHGHAHEESSERHRIAAAGGALLLEIHEDDAPPRFRLQRENSPASLGAGTVIETLRTDGSRHVFQMSDRGDYLESVEEIPEPHAFTARILMDDGTEHRVGFEEHHHGHAGAHRDNNMRAAIVHVAADAAVSILVIIGLILAKTFGWLWMDPLAGIVGACVIASWSYGLIRDTGAILLDMNPDRQLAAKLRDAIEVGGDRLDDLHLWRVGPGHLAAIISVTTDKQRDPNYYRNQLARFKILSHVTVEVVPARV